jgi:hypothetical protein
VVWCSLNTPLSRAVSFPADERERVWDHCSILSDNNATTARDSAASTKAKTNGKKLKENTSR